MSQVMFINQMIATPHFPQLIHQNGILIFANIAAARLFGLDNVDAFVEFAHSNNLFARSAETGPQNRNRQLKFRSIDGIEKKATVDEASIVWNGHPSSYVTMTLIEGENVANSDTFVTTSSKGSQDETYFLDSIDAAMDPARTDTGAMILVQKPFDLAIACMRLCDDHNALAQEIKVTLSLEISPKALNIFTGDAAKLSTAASCIIRHAIKRVPNGKVRIKLLVDEAGENIRLDICDNGAPYSPWDSVNLLESPTSANQNPINAESAPMLDLPMAQCIAQFLGGNVALKVNHIAGGLVRLRLPFPIAEGETRRTCRPETSHTPMQILIVEDNYTTQQVVKIILQALGYSPTIVANGQLCLEAMQISSFDLIFMDLHMPIMDGYEATRQIRRLEARSGDRNKPIPILALTADTRTKTRLKAQAAGVSGFLTKPVHIPQILSALTPIIEAIKQNETRQANVA